MPVKYKKINKIKNSKSNQALFMLNSTKIEIPTAHKAKIPTNKGFSSLKLSDVVFILLINEHL